MLNEMSKEFDKIYLSDESKELFVIYGYSGIIEL